MLRFLIRRTALGAVVLWLISMLVFALFFVAPGDVARTIAGRQATPETVALIQHRLGLDLPLWRHQLVARDGDIDVLEIVLARPPDGDGAAVIGLFAGFGH